LKQKKQEKQTQKKQNRSRREEREGGSSWRKEGRKEGRKGKRSQKKGSSIDTSQAINMHSQQISPLSVPGIFLDLAPSFLLVIFCHRALSQKTLDSTSQAIDMHSRQISPL
jgi:hypothetical protein